MRPVRIMSRPLLSFTEVGIKYSIAHIIRDVLSDPWRNLSYNKLVKGTPGSKFASCVASTGCARNYHSKDDVIIQRKSQTNEGAISSHENPFLKTLTLNLLHDDVIKWKHFSRNWPFVRGIHRSRWIPHTKASDAELWFFLWSASE